jgi:ribosomal-protein-alanine N-acetyltransferase
MSEKENLSMTLISIEDAESLSNLIVSNQGYFNRYLPKTVAANLTIADSTHFIQKISEDSAAQKQFLYTIKNSTEIIGLVYLKNLNWETKQGEFAYALSQKHTDKGMISQAVKQLTAIAFKNLGLESLIIITHKTNTASIKVAEKCGFKYSATLKNEFTPANEEPLDMELYKLRK